MVIIVLAVKVQDRPAEMKSSAVMLSRCKTSFNLGARVRDSTYVFQEASCHFVLLLGYAQGPPQLENLRGVQQGSTLEKIQSHMFAQPSHQPHLS